MSRLETEFLNQLGSSWEDATPGFQVQAFAKGKKIVDTEVGKTARYYDWASLTKIVFSTTRLMMLFDDKEFSLNDRVGRWVPWFPGPDRSSAPSAEARLKNLFSHSAGLTWWYPFYKNLALKTHPDGPQALAPEKAWEEFEKILKRRLTADFKRQALARPRVPISSTNAVYSDLDFFLLGAALLRMTNRSLYDNWLVVKERFALEETDFNRGNKRLHKINAYAPTENSPFRGGVQKGTVHDENCWALGGVAPHSGLFGPIDDLSSWALNIRKVKMSPASARSLISKNTIDLFTKRAVPVRRGDWALGFMMPTKGRASCGPGFSPQSVGHTGFTGTSVWLDPKRDLLVVILSNRVHPTRENKNIAMLRPQIHSLIANLAR